MEVSQINEFSNVYIPTPFRQLRRQPHERRGRGRDVAEVLANLDAQFPGFRNLC